MVTGPLPRDLAASQRHPARLCHPQGGPTGPSAQRLTTWPKPLPTHSWQLPHTINSPIPPKNLTRDSLVRLRVGCLFEFQLCGFGRDLSHLLDEAS